MKKIILIKFGGSLITDKTEENKVNLTEITKLSNLLKEVYAKNNDYSYLIGTGAGSFGHIQVENYDLKNGIKTEKQKLGMAKVEDSVSRLNRIVIESLLKCDLPAVSVNPSSIITLNNGNINQLFMESLLGFLELGMIPVIYGDIVYDKARGGTVVSTEKQFLNIVMKLKEKNYLIDRIIFCGITQGVVDLNGKTIKNITENSYDSFKNVFYENKYIDVTGGMKEKVEIALKIAKMGVKSIIINGSSLKDCILDNNYIGTLIE